MIYEKRVVSIGSSIGITVSPDLLKYLDLEKGDKIILEDKKDQDGIYLIIRKGE